MSKLVLRAHCDEPAEKLIKMGTAIIEIGKALQGKSISEARAIIMAVSELEKARVDNQALAEAAEKAGGARIYD